MKGERMSYLDSLNKEQREAVMQIEGPVLIMAGAGSGKTKALTCRIAYMLEQGIRPWEILAITFTNKAAKEMRDRVHQLVGPDAEKIWMYTFHSFGARFLRQEIEAMPPYTGKFTIYDSDDSRSVIKNLLKELNLDDKQYQPQAVQSRISNAKNALLSPEAFARTAAGNFHAEKIAEIYALYDKKMKQNNALDFDDLLLLTTELLSREEIREKWQKRFHYILIDEYQDTNHAQYLMAKYIAGKRENICAVGDADQSIYSWRGADLRNILDFQKDYPRAKMIKLEQNYRSTKTILTAANAVIQNNIDRPSKRLWTENETGTRIQHYHAADEREEAEFIARTMKEEHEKNGRSYDDMAVLYRMNAQSRAIEDAVKNKWIDYAMVGGVRFYERAEIKDLMAYLRLLANFRDDVSLRRILNVPKRGIGDTTVEKLAAFAAENGMSLFEAIMASESSGLPKAAQQKLQKFSALIFGFLNAAAENDIFSLLEKIVRETEYSKYIQEAKEPEERKNDREANIGELFNVAKEFQQENPKGTLDDFLEKTALVSDTDSYEENGGKVTLMTIHSAKGLEFPIVFLAGMDEGIFPGVRSLMDESKLEEERRLCYVGITRAKEKLYVTNTDVRTMYGQLKPYSPSRFLKEIPADLMDELKRDSGMEEQRDFRRRVDSQASKWALANSYAPRPKRIEPRPAAVYDWQVGDIAVHKLWGEGTVTEVIGEGKKMMLKLSFPGGQLRQIMVAFAPVTKKK